MDEEQQGEGENAEALRQAQGERDAALDQRDSEPGPLSLTLPRQGGEDPGPALLEALAERDAAREELRVAARRYREALIAGNPDVPGELIGGDSIGALDGSLEAARRVVEAVTLRQAQGEREKAAPAVPAGAPVRAGADVSGMSAVEKIRYGVSNP